MSTGWPAKIVYRLVDICRELAPLESHYESTAQDIDCERLSRAKSNAPRYRLLHFQYMMRRIKSNKIAKTAYKSALYVK
jgi:hypothetical protein